MADSSSKWFDESGARRALRRKRLVKLLLALALAALVAALFIRLG